jgi:hypothetical protein
VDNIEIDPREIGWDQWGVLVNMVMNLRVPENVGKLLSGCTIGSSQEGLSSVSKK